MAANGIFYSLRQRSGRAVTESDFKAQVISGLKDIKEVQSKMADLMERLVRVEVTEASKDDDIKELKAALDGLYNRVRVVEAELQRWNTIRKFVLWWLGTPAAVSITGGIIYYMLQSQGG